MTGQLRARLGVALVIGAIWLGAVVAPASAAVTTVRYVDDNTGPNRCHGTNFHSIQAAINASNNADIVYVCPGTYVEQLTIDVPGLTVQSLRFQRAHLIPPVVLSFPALVEISAPGARLRGFHIDIPAGPVGPAGVAACSHLQAAVVVLSQRVGVWGNYIDATGDNTLSGTCGYDIGILFLGTETLTSAVPLGPDKSSAKRNYIRDFKLGGIIVEGSDISVRVARNAIRYVHLDDPATCVLVNTFQAVPQAQFPCEPVENVGPNPINGVFGESVGIGVGGGALVDVAWNTVFSTLDFAQIFDGGQGIPLFGGIISFEAAAGSRITENVVTQVFIGIGVIPEGIPLAQPGGGGGLMTSGMEISFNRANEGFFGLIVDSDNNYVYANRARLNVLGIGVFDGENNEFINNDARYNFELDCYDETGPDGSGTAGTDNTWIDNFGNFNEPQEICIDTETPF